jgi:hypothetical protein
MRPGAALRAFSFGSNFVASLREYFVDDAKQNLTTQAEWALQDDTGRVLGSVTARLHLDFDANALYVSFFVPELSGVTGAEEKVLGQVDKVLAFRESVVVHAGYPEHMHQSEDLVFTGQVYIYSERPLSAQTKESLSVKYKAVGYHLSFRSREYLDQRMRVERPKAFISHDSRDKANVAQPLALRLSQMMIPVWYDEYSLKVGDSLRESIEQGLKECQKCILILTPNFLANGGWSKREYDSIFTREIVEKTKLILPVWHDVSVQEVFDYSPVLADKLAVGWSEGLEAVARKLSAAID